ncbi:MAG: hypothetical protein ACRDGR_03200 [bacterium]
MASAAPIDVAAPPEADASHRSDFDLHGIVGIRLVGAGPGDRAAIVRQLGPIEKPLDREPDVVIRFVDQLETNGRVRWLGLDDAGFTDDAFLVLRAKHKARAKVQIPFDRIGGRCEIVCERGLPAVPHLVAIVNLTALANGSLPLHASAFIWESVGVLATGWAKGGKTESLLAFATNGAKYVGDEWIYLSHDGRTMRGIPEPIRLWKWHLDELPDIRARLPRSDRLRLHVLDAAVRIAERGSEGGGKVPRLLQRLTPVLRRQAYVQLPPKFLFGRRALAGAPDKVFWMASHEMPDIVVEPVDPRDVAHRMVFSLQEERTDLLAAYRRFRFAFPDRRNELLESAEELQRSALLHVLDRKETYAVWHPYPVSIAALFEAMLPWVNGGA